MTAPSQLVDAATLADVLNVKRGFVYEHADGWSITRAAASAGVARQRLYELRTADADFAGEWDDAFEQGTDALEDELRRRATEGWTERTFDGDGKLMRSVQRMASQELLA